MSPLAARPGAVATSASFISTVFFTPGIDSGLPNAHFAGVFSTLAPYFSGILRTPSGDFSIVYLFRSTAAVPAIASSPSKALLGSCSSGF